MRLRVVIERLGVWALWVGQAIKQINNHFKRVIGGVYALGQSE